MTTGAAGGGRSNKQQTDGEEEIGRNGEYAQAMCLGGQGTRVNIGGGRGGTRAIFGGQGTKTIILNKLRVRV